RQGRATNVAGAFRVKRRFVKLVENRSVVIIDDVMTTGATLNEIAKLLRRHQATKINGLVVARVLLTRSGL
ncbi:MAG: phosphoribosyltransferase family protein, partial [Alphaproteobacteria bacterium]|nr:phosphoribosyltransferase family protein [Alphaproteobacteria bacterium]